MRLCAAGEPPPATVETTETRGRAVAMAAVASCVSVKELPGATTTAGEEGFRTLTGQRNAASYRDERGNEGRHRNESWATHTHSIDAPL